MDREGSSHVFRALNNQIPCRIHNRKNLLEIRYEDVPQSTKLSQFALSQYLSLFPTVNIVTSYTIKIQPKSLQDMCLIKIADTLETPELKTLKAVCKVQRSIMSLRLPIIYNYPLMQKKIPERAIKYKEKQAIAITDKCPRGHIVTKQYYELTFYLDFFCTVCGMSIFVDKIK
ncbi:hypothetical protein [Rachiplusia nu nucleopolyhedrovirus]|uniref:Uncharacterized protein n=1 Tax=Rachiplusia nu nucleopolyhedrovirus TaxID=2605775 RepID=A0AAF1DB53_9ABAC|nr:hypothetical protein QKQ55_gp069 [Rachiplusia nu nucleopolyhedrovirus]QEI03671.1 hypothetical protein [Rachiplusia nu nucleopolyhedrovirus]